MNSMPPIAPLPDPLEQELAYLRLENAEQRAQISILLDGHPNILLLLDNEGRLVLCTQTFLELSDKPQMAALKGRTYQELLDGLLDGAPREQLDAAIETALRERCAVTLGDWLSWSTATDPRFYSMELIPVSGGALASFHDLTDYVQEKQRAEAASNVKSDFLATISHEIRTPMNAILGMAEILSRSNLDERQQKAITDIKSSSRALLTIINDILDFSKIESDRLVIAERPFRPRELFHSLYTMFAPQCEGKQLLLRFETFDDLPRTLFGDENRIRQVLTNLLSNAVKYTDEGSVTLRAGWMENNTLRIDVRDTGTGIREEDQARLFRPFEQLDARKSKHVSGTGLGLAISNRLCQLMGGRLWLQSKYGAGSTFSLELPCAPLDDDTVIPRPGELTAQDEFSATGARVLVVDDIDINLSVAEAVLGLFDIQPALSLSGSQAVELAEQEPYDVIFMDQMMPGMDGIEAMQRIRAADGDAVHTPIIALTANAVEGAERMYLDHGFDGFLSKPLELDALSRCLRKWLPEALVRPRNPA